MKKKIFYLGISLFFLISTAASGLPAFPGAEGFGATAIGGRGGKIIIVDNLNDSGIGSLRSACKMEGPRTIIFRVSGEINLISPLHIDTSYLTIAGQTAPGNGITLKSEKFTFSGPMLQIRKGAHDIIIRYLKLRVGRAEGNTSLNNDNLSIYHGSKIIFDHISSQWASDENMTIYPGKKGRSVTDVTFQRCIIGPTLYPHSTGSLISRAKNLENGFDRYSLHHNLYIHNSHRNPRIVGDLGRENNHLNIEVINNVVYNWKHRVGTTRGNAHIDFLGNYWKAGPMSKKKLTHIFRHEHVTNKNKIDFQLAPSIYIKGNIQTPNFRDATKDNWPLLSFHYTDGQKRYKEGGQLPKSWSRSTRIKQGKYSVNIQPALTTYRSIIGDLTFLGDIGDNARLDENGQQVTKRDTFDKNLLLDVINNTGPTLKAKATFVSDYGGYPKNKESIAYKDSDRDGMPDAWEISKGLNPKDNTDASKVSLSPEGYTNIEVFINNLQTKSR